MHQVHAICTQSIIACHPPDKRYITTHHNTEFIYLSVEGKGRIVGCFVHCILASVLTRVPPLKFLSLALLLPPSSILPHFVPSSLVPFLNPSSTPAPPSLTSSLPPTLPLLPPSHNPSFLAPCLTGSMYTVCVCLFGKLH